MGVPENRPEQGHFRAVVNDEGAVLWAWWYAAAMRFVPAVLTVLLLASALAKKMNRHCPLSSGVAQSVV